MPAPAQTAEKPPGFRSTQIFCGFFLGFDIFIVGAPMFGVYTGLALALWIVPRIFIAWKRPEVRRHRVTVALIIAACLAVDCGAFLASEFVAEKRIIEVANALARYKSERTSYPLRLQDLVPAYMPAIPSAKPLSLWAGGPMYLYEPSAPMLMYVSIPPFGRRVLNVVTREWTEVD